jgi:cytosine/adenosine deaminase-related metal-dependent hydrolase
VLGEAVTDQDAPWKAPAIRRRRRGRTTSFIEKWNGRLDGRIRAWAMPFSYETCSAGLLQSLKRVVDEHRTGLTLHHNSGTKAQDTVACEQPDRYLESIGARPERAPAHCLASTGGRRWRGLAPRSRCARSLAKGCVASPGGRMPSSSPAV